MSEPFMHLCQVTTLCVKSAAPGVKSTAPGVKSKAPGVKSTAIGSRLCDLRFAFFTSGWIFFSSCTIPSVYCPYRRRLGIQLHYPGDQRSM